ncbi:MAG TPA: tetratricopeptide repeat protein [Gemmatimonadales bacterium]|nr:tetratricopeptide repeat protein [Gemmatimonadales bacterium]
MNRESLADLRREYSRLVGRLSEPMDTPARTELKAAIVALFRRTESHIDELSSFKESIRALVDGFKALPPGTDDQRQSVRHDHIGASTHIERGWTALAGGDWRRAEILFRDALALDPGNGEAEALLGWSLMHQDRGDEALQRCLQVLVRQPEHGLARAAVGAICLRKGITGEAIEHLSRAVRAGGDPRAMLYAHYWLGVAYLEREMLNDAIEVLRKAVAMGPNLAEGWTELGRAWWLKSERDEARKAWQTGAAIRHSPFAAAARGLLELADSGGSIPRSPLG